MTYDWTETVDEERVDLDYFRMIDTRMRRDHWFAQGKDGPLFSRLIPYAQLERKKVLEIGCGLGSVAQEFARQGADITSIDLTSRAVRLSSRRFVLQSLSGAFLQANAEELPFKDNTFDYVWSWGVLHHTPGTERAIGEIRRILKQGGKVGIMMYNRYSLRNLFRVILFRGVFQLKLLRNSLEELESRYSDGYIAKHFSMRQVRALFRDFVEVRLLIYGQRSEIIPGYHLLPEAITMPVEPLIRALLRRFGWFLFIEARKPS